MRLGRYHARLFEGYPDFELRAVNSFLEPFCGRSSPKLSKSSKLDFWLRFEGPSVAYVNDPPAANRDPVTHVSTPWHAPTDIRPGLSGSFNLCSTSVGWQTMLKLSCWARSTNPSTFGRKRAWALQTSEPESDCGRARILDFFKHTCV